MAVILIVVLQYSSTPVKWFCLHHPPPPWSAICFCSVRMRSIGQISVVGQSSCNWHHVCLHLRSWLKVKGTFKDISCTLILEPHTLKLSHSSIFYTIFSKPQVTAAVCCPLLLIVILIWTTTRLPRPRRLDVFCYPTTLCQRATVSRSNLTWMRSPSKDNARLSWKLLMLKAIRSSCMPKNFAFPRLVLLCMRMEIPHFLLLLNAKKYVHDHNPW